MLSVFSPYSAVAPLQLYSSLIVVNNRITGRWRSRACKTHMPRYAPSAVSLYSAISFTSRSFTSASSATCKVSSMSIHKFDT